MRVLVVGAASGLGASLAASLLQNTQHTLVTVDDLRVERDLQNLQFALSHKRGDRHRFYLCQISDAHIANKLFELERPDWVVFCKTPEKDTYHQSLVRTIISAKQYGARLIYLAPDSWSSDRNESYKYGIEICESESNDGTAHVLNTGRIFGPRQEEGDIITHAMGRILNGEWPNTALASDRPREWLYVKDALSAIETLICSNNISGKYTASSGNIASEHEVMMCLQMISEGRGFEFSKHDIHILDSSKLIELGWSPKYQLRDALEHTLSWYSINAWARNAVAVI